MDADAANMLKLPKSVISSLTVIFVLYCQFYTADVTFGDPPLIQKHTQFSNNSFMLVHTLKGDVYLVDRYSGSVQWVKTLGKALEVFYDEGPILIVDPLEGRLYEYSNDASKDMLTHLDHSVMGYVRRSPAYYKNYISFGSKTDSWLSLDMSTGKVLQVSNHNSVQQCPNPIEPEGDSIPTFQPSGDFIGLGQTQYNLLFRDPVTGRPKLNITYSTFSAHTEPDLKSMDLQHIATTQPRLLTFRDRKLLWSLPLSSPVVGLYAVWNPSQPSECRITPRPIAQSESLESLAESMVEQSPDTNANLDEHRSSSARVVPECKTHVKPSFSPHVPHVLKRIAFTTYALNLKNEILLSPTFMNTRLEAKFNSTLDLTLSLLVDSSPAAELFAIPCVAEASLKLRGIRRTPEHFRLEGPGLTTRKPGESSNAEAVDVWFRSLIGLYELPPTQLNRWVSNNYIPLWARVSRLRQITDGTTKWAVIVPPLLTDGDPENWKAVGNDTEQNSKKHPLGVHSKYDIRLTSLVLISTLTVCVVFSVYFLKKVHPKFNGTKKGIKIRSPASHRAAETDSSFLPAYFDLPDKDGWAGCSAEEAGQPDAIRFNLNHILGHGANGTMVFAGTFGQHQTAVKRIVRQPFLEKHWRREHTILLHHHHPNLIRCFWTGSTANFHYLVMQRCTVTLSEVLQNSVNNISHWGLTPISVIHQFMQAVTWLHHNRIVHRDLKPSNVLITSTDTESRVVVGDFGLSRPLPVGRHDITNSFGPHTALALNRPQATEHYHTTIEGHRTTEHQPHGCSVKYCTHCKQATGTLDAPSGDQTSVGVSYGTLGWMAPELCDPCPGHLTYAIDIFSCGLLAYHVLTGGGHPFDRSRSGDSDQPSGSQKEGSCSSEGDSHQNLVRSSGLSPSTSCSDVTVDLFYSPTTLLSRHHARQLAIAENRPPNLNQLTDDCADIAAGVLSRQLIQTMLSHDPSARPSAEEILAYPLFWAPGKVMRFISEVSDLLDTRDSETWDAKMIGFDPETQSDSVNERTLSPGKGRFAQKRYVLLNDIESCSRLVFNEHWFHRLEPDIVQDLLTTRGYQDTSLLDLLRAIRNKRSHFWHLSEHTRKLLGHTQEGLAIYWTSRFPCLLPLLYDLSRHYLSRCSVMTEFIPTLRTGQTPTSPYTVSEWWLSIKPGPLATPTRTCEDEGDSVSASRVVTPLSVTRKRLPDKPWKRGEVLSTSGISATPFPESDPVPEDGLVNAPEVCPILNMREHNIECGNKFILADQPRHRRRPNQPKKVRPLKRKTDREAILEKAGCELPSIVIQPESFAH
ncbi:hypothetical protein EG68_04810 [Paragonimus skrjabini miyazakii]|uniref:non-specific serine/threonine protein kinase n=1 Tax=Paragonimus skrjabini miyazakii TaxID=59628 RepID=A0A8S9YSE0_9TREM|nr:hypothetical protein EG68_04810 [Paragonimus skrjabini miyazakii]